MTQVIPQKFSKNQYFNLTVAPFKIYKITSITNDPHTIENQEQPIYLIPLISDYGFKVSFATHSVFSRKAIQVLIESNVPILRLDMSRNELDGISPEARSGYYDVVCRDEHLRVFIVEVKYDFLK